MIIFQFWNLNRNSIFCRYIGNNKNNDNNNDNIDNIQWIQDRRLQTIVHKWI